MVGVRGRQNTVREGLGGGETAPGPPSLPWTTVGAGEWARSRAESCPSSPEERSCQGRGGSVCWRTYSVLRPGKGEWWSRWYGRLRLRLGSGGGGGEEGDRKAAGKGGGKGRRRDWLAEESAAHGMEQSGASREQRKSDGKVCAKEGGAETWKGRKEEGGGRASPRQPPPFARMDSLFHRRGRRPPPPPLRERVPLSGGALTAIGGGGGGRGLGAKWIHLREQAGSLGPAGACE